MRRRYAADPPVWALAVLAQRLLLKIKSKLLGILFHAPALYLGPGCHVHGARFISFGRGVYAHGNLWLEAVHSYREQRFTPTITLEDGVSLSDSVHISAIGSIRLGSHTLIGSRVHITDHSHGRYAGAMQSHPQQRPVERELYSGGPVLIGSNVWIGDNAVIIGPVKIGDGAVIGANSVVTRDVPSHAMAVGVPAAVIKCFDPGTGIWERVRNTKQQ